MTTTAQNVEDARDRNQTRLRLPVTSNITINAGDLVYWDATNFTVTPLTASSQVASNFLGTALQSSATLIYPGDATQVGILVLVRAVVWLNTTAAETYNHFDDVTGTSDSQTIIKSGATSTNRVGFVLIDPPNTPRALQATPTPETVTGASGLKIRVCLEPKHKYAAAV